MKKAVLVVVLALLLAAVGWAANQGGLHSKDVTIEGKLSCTYCNLPAPVNCTKECCLGCLKAGDPVLLTDAKGSLYILIGGQKDKPLLTPEMMNWVLEKVKVRGTLVRRGGVQGIYVKAIEKAP